MSKALVAIAFMVGLAAAAGLQELRLSASINHHKAIHAEYVASVAEAATAAVTAHANEADRMHEANGELDYKYTQELANAKAESDKLRDAVLAGERRLYINTKTPACSGGVPSTTSTTSLDDGANRAELDPATANRIISLTDAGDEAIRKLTSCQLYACNIQSKYIQASGDGLGLSNRCKLLIEKNNE